MVTRPNYFDSGCIYYYKLISQLLSVDLYELVVDLQGHGAQKLLCLVFSFVETLIPLFKVSV